MLKVFAQNYVDLGRSLESLSMSLYMSDLDKETLTTEERKNDEQSAKRELQRLSKHCSQLSLSTSEKLIARAIEDVPTTSRELEIYLEAVDIELKQRLFFFVPPHRAIHYNSQFPETQVGALPLTSAELVRAGNCFAFGEYTACIFHAMRAAEICLRLTAESLPNVQLPPDIPGWHLIIEKIESEIRDMKQLPKTQSRDEDLEFYSAGAAQFRYFKEAWRDHVSHAKKSYDEETARVVFGGVRDFVSTLPARLKEPAI